MAMSKQIQEIHTLLVKWGNNVAANQEAVLNAVIDILKREDAIPVAQDNTSNPLVPIEELFTTHEATLQSPSSIGDPAPTPIAKPKRTKKK